MPAADSYPLLSKAELCTRLAAGLSSGATVVTPNHRLALTLAREFDDGRAAAGLEAWDTPDILPLPAFVERLHDDALHSDAAPDIPPLLSAVQEQALWESAVRASSAGQALLAVPEAARVAREAWELVQAWRLKPRLAKFPLDEDGRAWHDWMRRYERALRSTGCTDAASVADVVAAACGDPKVRRPRLLVCYGFDAFTPQQSALLGVLRQSGCDIAMSGPDRCAAEVRRVACVDARDEIRTAAAWARTCLEDGARSIGVIVPDIASNRASVVREFSAQMHPAYALPGRGAGVQPFNVSIGVALTGHAPVAAATMLLELACEGMEFERASRLVRSPFLIGAETEMARRAQLDAVLRERAEPVLTLDRLNVLLARDAAGCPELSRCVAKLAEYRRTRLRGMLAPSEWARRMVDLLAIAGFPGERALDSAEYQAVSKWHEVLAAFASLDRVESRLRYAEAVARVRRIAADTLFQPETPDVPIQILGVIEAAGMTFDRLWVMGLTDEAWPPAPRPNPFIPVEVQRAAGLPRSSAAESLARARALTGEWMRAAGEVVLSHALRDGDRDLAPSPLIASVPAGAADARVPASYREVVHAARAVESVADDAGPALANGEPVTAGTLAIKDQAACPFRAYARHRLAAARPGSPHAGLDPLERGTLVHRVLAQVWDRLRTRAALDAARSDQLDALLREAADTAVNEMRQRRPTTLGGRFAEIERQRLTRIARAWLELERRRGDFTVLATEDRRRIEIGGLAFNARLDRVDELPDGRRIIIDYKTGAPLAASMTGARPEEPQLPLYLVATEPAAAAVAFARVRAGDMGYTGLARDGDLLPDVAAFEATPLGRDRGDWNDQVDAWRHDLARLAAALVAGDAEVDPKDAGTCRYCDAQPFCRIRERMDAPDFDEDEA